MLMSTRLQTSGLGETCLLSFFFYFQMQTTFVVQALHMRLDVFNVNYTVLFYNSSAQEYPIVGKVSYLM